MDNTPTEPDYIFQTRDNYVADRLRKAILRGQLKPGEKLDQKDIAKLLNVSRSPIREALRTLAAEGLVEVYPHQGAVVTELSPKELEEIYFIRGVLEGMAARLAAPEMDAARIASMEEILAELATTTELDRWIDLNRAFHNAIYKAANRPRLTAIIESLRNTAAPYIRQYITTVDHTSDASTAHQKILDACKDRDGTKAEEETKKHLMAVCEGVLVLLESSAKTP